MAAREVTVTSTQRFFIGACFAGYPLILACAPVGSGLIRAAWVAVFLGASAFMVVRAGRMRVVASEHGVVVQNFGRAYDLPWPEIASVDAARSDNITGLVTTIYLRRRAGRDVVARIASSYSSAKVERWRDQITSVRR